MQVRVMAALLAMSGTISAAEPSAQISPSVLSDVTAWRRDLHQHPELSNREVRTSKIVADELKKLGYTVRTGVAHTGVTGVLKGGKPGPKLAIRADMDALPVTEQVDVPFASKVKSEYLGKTVGVMHACGHDAHTAMLLGLAETFAKMKNDLPGEIMLVFQPAEEGVPPGETGGAPGMVRDGIFKDFKPDAVFGMHVVAAYNVGKVGVRAGGAMASSDTFRMTVHGKQAHGATPWMGIDPIVTAAEIVTMAQTIVSRQLNLNKEPAVVTFGTFNGGSRFNIVPDAADLSGTIRTFDEGMRKQIITSLTGIAEHVAAANGATVEVQMPKSDEDRNPVNYNDPALTARVRVSLEKALGNEHVIDAERWTASEDFPHLAIGAKAPSVYFFVGATPAGQDAATAPTNHSPKFFLDEGALAVGMTAMLQASLDFLSGGK
ncbi:MAG: amidohydrolase [Rudaea sp.]|uniref:amidohydrolase n=2 Tax=unclassified Rudaea TaxID=2627037 RepID=UPI0010F72F3C|nr:amidohydrolase [Rudaea sp.]MBN8885233.1 amidohydrolase [Rudaea sp.]MBR0345983.1 amidohydrolase [Rudaea sp.]